MEDICTAKKCRGKPAHKKHYCRICDITGVSHEPDKCKQRCIDCPKQKIHHKDTCCFCKTEHKKEDCNHKCKIPQCKRVHHNSTCCNCGGRHKLNQCTVMCETTCKVEHPSWVCCVCIEDLSISRVLHGKPPYTQKDLDGERGLRLFHSLEECPKGLKDCKHCGRKCYVKTTDEERCVFNPTLQSRVEQSVIQQGQELFYMHDRHTSIKAELIK